MTRRNYGLTNFYLKIGVAFLVLGPALLVGSFLLHPSSSSSFLMYIGCGLVTGGIIIYIVGRISKALASASS